MAKNFGRVNVSVTAPTGGLTAGLANASKQVTGFSSQIRKISIATTFLAAERAANVFAGTVRRAYSALSQFVTAASDLTEEQSKSGVVFGTASRTVAAFAKQARAIGISETAALKATGTYGNLFRSMGFGVEQTAQFSTRLTALAADLASFNNVSMDDALLALRAALVGEIEPIRRLGVLLNEQTLKAEAIALGFGKISGVLPPVIRLQAAYSSILKQTTLAQGDFQRTSKDFANQTRIMQANFANLSAELGKAFLPLFKQVSEALIGAVPTMQVLVEQITTFLTGTKKDFDNAIESANSFSDALRVIYREMVRLKGFGELGAAFFGSAAAGSNMMMEDVTWLLGFEQASKAFGAEARVFDIATQRLLKASQLNMTQPDRGFGLALQNKMAQMNARDQIAKGLEQANKARVNLANLERKRLADALKPVATFAADAFDGAKQYAGGLAIVARESAAGFARAAIGGVQRQSSSIVSESLQAIVAGTSEAEAFQNRIARGYDPRRVENDASRTASATEQTVTVLNQIEALLNRLDLGLASIGV